MSLSHNNSAHSHDHDVRGSSRDRFAINVPACPENNMYYKNSTLQALSVTPSSKFDVETWLNPGHQGWKAATTSPFIERKPFGSNRLTNRKNALSHDKI